MGNCVTCGSATSCGTGLFGSAVEGRGDRKMNMPRAANAPLPRQAKNHLRPMKRLLSRNGRNRFITATIRYSQDETNEGADCCWCAEKEGDSILTGHAPFRISPSLNT